MTALGITLTVIASLLAGVGAGVLIICGVFMYYWRR